MRTLIGVVSCLLALNVNASVIYTYTGNNFNSFTGNTFDNSMSVSGYIELDGNLAPNLVNQNVNPLSYSFTDGISTITKETVTGGDIFRLYTNGSGNIFMWSVSIFNYMPDPAQIGDTAPSIRTRHEVTSSADETVDFGQLATCIKLQSGNKCSQNSVDLGEIYNAQGVWAVSAVPIPAAVWLFGSGLIGLIGLARSKEKY